MKHRAEKRSWRFGVRPARIARGGDGDDREGGATDRADGAGDRRGREGGARAPGYLPRMAAALAFIAFS